MICQEFNINQAKGVRIFNEISLGDLVLPKGHSLTDEDIIFLKLQGLETIFGALMEDDDISFQTALGIIAAKLCGEGTAYYIGANGICKIIAAVPGVFINSEDRVAKFNRLTPHAILNTIEPYSQVLENEVIAELEMTVPIIAQADVDELVFKLSGNVDLLQVGILQPQKVALLYSKFYNDKAETKHFTNVVKKLVKEFAPLDLQFGNEYNTLHNQNSLADGLEDALEDKNDIIFVITGRRSSCALDVVPAAINSLVTEVANPQISQVNASDLIIAERRGQKIICLPYAYDKADTSLINRYVKQAIYAGKLNSFEFSHHQNAVLPNGIQVGKEEQAAVIAAGKKAGKNSAIVGAVVLAAGIGSRSGRNKLMVNVGKEPLFMKAVNAALRSKASPVFVITGYHDEEMQPILENVDVNVLYNPAYRSGVRTSISLGLKSMPNFCEGAVIIPADMPNITAAEIDKLIASFKPGKERQLSLFTNRGIKQNPVIWSRDLYDKADIVPENAALRQVFIEHSDYTNTVELKDSSKFFDVTFPSDVSQIADKE